MTNWEKGYGLGMNALVSLVCCLTEPKTDKGVTYLVLPGKKTVEMH